MSQGAPTSFHVMAKPAGARCNLQCAYCFFPEKESLYPGSDFRMSHEVMEAYIRQTLEARQTSEVALAWQGGEPTLMGLDFFRRAVEVIKRHQKPGTTIEHTIQTNGVLLDDQWCRFLHENKILVGISIDGPRAMHDAYRRDKAGGAVFEKVVRAVRLMQRHQVEFNVLCTVNAVNSLHPIEVYRFFRDELKTPYLQFLPVAERANGGGLQDNHAVTDRSVRPEQYGRFLIEIFDEWIKRDAGKVFVQFFDGVLASWVYGRSSLCVLQPTCGQSVALEHNGDVYSCDHFVEPGFLLGNILQAPLHELVDSEKQREFGREKASTLPSQCLCCPFLFTCHGECPRNRVAGLNWLCKGLRAFFEHTQAPMKIMADLIRHGRLAEEVMAIVAAEQFRAPSGALPTHDAPLCSGGLGPNVPAPSLHGYRGRWELP